LQLWFEGGYFGLMIGVWIIYRIIWLGNKYKTLDSAVALSGALLAMICCSMGQPVFHMVNLSTVSLVAFAILESIHNQERINVHKIQRS
jgi:hypothetical protein